MSSTEIRSMDIETIAHSYFSLRLVSKIGGKKMVFDGMNGRLYLFKEITRGASPMILRKSESELEELEDDQTVRRIKDVASMTEDIAGSDVRSKLVNRLKEFGIEGLRICKRPFFYNSQKRIHVDEIPLTEISGEERNILNDILEVFITEEPCSSAFSDELEHRRVEPVEYFSNKPGSRPYKRGGKKTKKNKRRGKKSVRK
jgi:hypothetical protein